MRRLSVDYIYQNLLKGRRLQNQKKKNALTPNTNERKWRQPQFQLHLVTKSHSRQELGLSTLSAAVHLQKMMPCTMFRSIQTFFVNGIFTERFHFVYVCVCARIDFLFTIRLLTL